MTQKGWARGEGASATTLAPDALGDPALNPPRIFANRLVYVGRPFDDLIVSDAPGLQLLVMFPLG